jgi:hypothetical protein
MKALTNFDNGESTTSQRVWMMLWLVLSQVSGGILFGRPNVGAGVGDVLISIFVTLFYSPASIGGFVVVGQMMIADQVCVIV